MSFRTSSGKSESAFSRGDSGRAFSRVRQSLQREGLPFANVLTAARLADVFDGVSAVVLASRGVGVSGDACGGVVVAGLVLEPCSGKETGEAALFRELLPLLLAGDLVVADRYYGGWFTIALLQERDVNVVTRLHQHRTADFRCGRRLGADDHLVEWPKPQRPEWLDQETYDRLPDTRCVREMQYAVREAGFRTQSLVVVTTLRDADEVSREDLADLYRQRWQVELDLRSIKSTMKLDVLRCQTPEMACTELWMWLLAYNLVRHSLLQAADAAESTPRQLSFCAGQQFLANTWLLATTPPHAITSLIELRLIHMASHRVGNRPNRIEPRALKRRANPYDWLTKPRAEARAQLMTGCSP